MDRRKFVKVAGVSTAVGLTGCVHGGGGNGNGEDGEDGEDGDTGDSNGGGGNGGSGASFEDRTGQSEVSVDVGAGQTGLAFAPENVRISTGTTITWEWTGQGGQHNVVHQPSEDQDTTGLSEAAFESELVESSEKTFTHTFEETGTFFYVCTIHKASGMVGLVEVVE